MLHKILCLKAKGWLFFLSELTNRLETLSVEDFLSVNWVVSHEVANLIYPSFLGILEER